MRIPHDIIIKPIITEKVWKIWQKESILSWLIKNQTNLK